MVSHPEVTAIDAAKYLRDTESTVEQQAIEDRTSEFIFPGHWAARKILASRVKGKVLRGGATESPSSSNNHSHSRNSHSRNSSRRKSHL
jgi:hypothetical protein